MTKLNTPLQGECTWQINTVTKLNAIWIFSRDFLILQQHSFQLFALNNYSTQKNSVSDPDSIRSVDLDSDSDSGFRIRFGFRIRIPDSDSGFGFRIQIPDSDSGFGFRIRIPDSDSGFGFWIPDSDSGFRIRIPDPDPEGQI